MTMSKIFLGPFAIKLETFNYSDNVHYRSIMLIMYVLVDSLPYSQNLITAWYALSSMIHETWKALLCICP